MTLTPLTHRSNGDSLGFSLAVRTYGQVADEMRQRHGIRMSPQRVQQICARAERKLRKEMEGANPWA